MFRYITTYTDVIFVNNYTAEILPAAPIVFVLMERETTTQEFSATINANVSGLPYEVISYEWSIISDNSGSAIKTDIDSLNVSYTFSEPGVYTLEYYSATIDGTNENCEYRDMIDFEVGINTSIVSDEIICVGVDFECFFWR